MLETLHIRVENRGSAEQAVCLFNDQPCPEELHVSMPDSNLNYREISAWVRLNGFRGFLRRISNAKQLPFKYSYSDGRSAYFMPAFVRRSKDGVNVWHHEPVEIDQQLYIRVIIPPQVTVSYFFHREETTFI